MFSHKPIRPILISPYYSICASNSKFQTLKMKHHSRRKDILKSLSSVIMNGKIFAAGKKFYNNEPVANVIKPFTTVSNDFS